MSKLVSFLAFLPLCCSAQPPEQALLWRITPADGGPPSYLLGTIHSRDARAYTVMDLAERAIQATAAVFGELDMAEASAAKATLAAQAMMPGGTTLRELYPAKRYRRVEKSLRDKLGPMFLLVQHMKPLLLSSLITEEEMRKDSAQVLDQFLQAHARDNGKVVGGIETLGEQLAALDEVPLKEQAEVLYRTVRTRGHANATEELMNAYAAQDLAGIERLMEADGMSQALAQPLVDHRNAKMVHRMDSLMRVRTTFFAIGAAHLPGTQGLLAGLRARGATVVAITRPEMIAVPPEDPLH